MNVSARRHFFGTIRVMNSRQRVLDAVDHKSTDRVPMNFLAHEGVSQALIDRLGLADHEELLQFFGIDMRRVGTYGSVSLPVEGPDAEGFYRNMWGVRYKDPEGGPVRQIPPFDDDTTLDEIHAHDWPDPAKLDLSWVKPECEKHFEKYAVYGSPWGPFFHEAWWLMGQENFYVWMYTKPDHLRACIDHIVDFEMVSTTRFIEAAGGMLDFTYFGNDFGSQRGSLMSPELFDTFIRPSVKRYYDLSHGHGLDVMQHSCGGIRELIPFLIQDGVNVIDPVQTYATGMEFDGLVRDFGSRVTFHGGVDTQTTLPFGTTEEVRNEVRHYLKTTKGKGGYILMSSQEYIEDVPLDNILAVYEEGGRR